MILYRSNRVVAVASVSTTYFYFIGFGYIMSDNVKDSILCMVLIILVFVVL